MKPRSFKAWGVCIDCHFEGMIEYFHLPDEDYEDPEASGVVLVQLCPSCETTEHSLIPIDYYQEMLAEIALREGPDEEE